MQQFQNAEVRHPVVDHPLVLYGTASVLGWRPLAILLVAVSEVFFKLGISPDVAIN